ncbi:hypothetical protein HDU98_004761, partial [Podochytrium sp. JEL0797]
MQPHTTTRTPSATDSTTATSEAASATTTTTTTTTAAPASLPRLNTLSARSSSDSPRSVMEGRVQVVMELLQRTLRLAGVASNPGSVPLGVPRGSVSGSLSSSVSGSVPGSVPGSLPSREASTTKDTLAALFSHHAQLAAQARVVSGQHAALQGGMQFRDKQRATQLLRKARQLHIDAEVKMSHINANIKKLQQEDPLGADAFVATLKDNPLQHFTPNISTNSISGGSIGGPFQALNMSNPSSALPTPPTSHTLPAHQDPSTLLILRRLSILVASAFAAPDVDPFGTHFLLHALILIRRFLFPATPRSLSPAMTLAVEDLKQDPVNLYLCSLMLVECQLRDGQTSTSIWRKWLAHAINNASSTATFDTISAKLVSAKRTLVKALDHNILISTSEYDMFLQVFRGCLSSRNSKQFTQRYAENHDVIGRMGGSEGYGVRNAGPGGGSIGIPVLPGVTPTQQFPFVFTASVGGSGLATGSSTHSSVSSSIHGGSITTLPPPSTLLPPTNSHQLAPLIPQAMTSTSRQHPFKLAPIRNAVSFSGGAYPFHNLHPMSMPLPPFNLSSVGGVGGGGVPQPQQASVTGRLLKSPLLLHRKVSRSPLVDHEEEERVRNLGGGGGVGGGGFSYAMPRVGSPMDAGSSARDPMGGVGLLLNHGGGGGNGG